MKKIKEVVLEVLIWLAIFAIITFMAIPQISIFIDSL